MSHIKFNHVEAKMMSAHSVFRLSVPELSIEQGDIVCFLGESGAGKSSLLRCINALLKIDQGQVLIKGVDIQHTDKATLQALRKGIGMVFQGFNLISNKTVYENVAVNMRICRNLNHGKVLECLEFVGLGAMAGKYPVQLSGGERQRVAIASVLAQNSEIMLLDEPVAALDRRTAANIAGLLKEVNRVYGTTIILASHELNFIKELAHTAYLVAGGTIVKTLPIHPPENGTSHPTNYTDYVEDFLCRQ